MSFIFKLINYDNANIAKLFVFRSLLTSFFSENLAYVLFNKLYARNSPLFMIYFVISHQNV